MSTDYNIEVNEIAVACEQVTATVDWSMPTGERYSGPLVIGVYPSESNPDLFITQEGRTIQFPAELLPTVIRQLKRAHKIATGAAQ